VTPDYVASAYRRLIEVGETVTVRRYSGIGALRTSDDFEARARVAGYEPNELVGDIRQGDLRVVILVEDLVSEGFELPLTQNDKVVVRGKELAVLGPDDSTRRIAGEAIALDVRVRG